MSDHLSYETNRILDDQAHADDLCQRFEKSDAFAGWAVEFALEHPDAVLVAAEHWQDDLMEAAAPQSYGRNVAGWPKGAA